MTQERSPLPLPSALGRKGNQGRGEGNGKGQVRPFTNKTRPQTCRIQRLWPPSSPLSRRGREPACAVLKPYAIALSPQRLRHYFKSKEAILGAIAQSVTHASTKQFGRTMGSAGAGAALVSDVQHAKARRGHGGSSLFLDRARAIDLPRILIARVLAPAVPGTINRYLSRNTIFASGCSL